MFGEADFVPALAYPFVSLFQVDDLAAFETVMAVLLKWSGTWLTTFPHPPIPVLNTVEQIIHVHDPKLMSHLVSLGISSQTYAWGMLRSVFTEVLNKSEWLRLWDHLFTNAHDPNLMLCAVAAYTVYNRNALVSATDKQEVEPFFHRQNPINMSDFILLMYEIRRKVSASPSAASDLHRNATQPQTPPNPTLPHRRPHRCYPRPERASTEKKLTTPTRGRRSSPVKAERQRRAVTCLDPY